jgi:hypothetical protein
VYYAYAGEEGSHFDWGGQMRDSDEMRNKLILSCGLRWMSLDNSSDDYEIDE